MKKNKNKVLIVESLAKNGCHEIINSALVVMCSEIFGQISISATEEAKKDIKKTLSKFGYTKIIPELKFNPYKVKEYKYHTLKRIVSAIRDIQNLFFAKREEVVIYTYARIISFITINFLNLILKKKILFIYHGNLESTLNHSLGRKALILLFKKGKINKNIRICVLGSSIKKNLDSYLNRENRKRFFSIDHPYFFTPSKSKKKLNQKLILSTVGFMSNSKGLKELIRLSEFFKDNVNFHIIGKVSDEINPADYPGITFISRKGKQIPRERFEKEIKKSDFILYLYPKDSYKLTASGAIFDAINMEKPIIAIENDYFKSILTNNPIGYLEKNTERIKKRIEYILENNETILKEYNKFIENEQKLKKKFSPKKITIDFERELKKNKFITG